MTNITLIGYGKMGKMIADAACRYDASIVSTIDPQEDSSYRDITAESVQHADVCIEFSHPGVVLQNLEKCASLGKNIVLGTTGWNKSFDVVSALARDHDIGLIYGANFSIGMNLFFRIIENAAKEFDRFSEYDLFGYELHHRQKADSPSGTAIALSEILVEHTSRKSIPQYEKLNRKIEAEELHFASIRAGFFPGTHTVGFDSEADTIELCHRVRSRMCFAIGALKAANWIKGKKGLYSFKDMVEDILC